MLEQTNPDHGSHDTHHADRETAPISVSAPRAAAVMAMAAPSRHADRLGEMIARAEMLLLHLESRLHEEREVSDRAVRTAGEVEERLRIGVKMLQALDLQVARGEEAVGKAQTLANDAGARLSEATAGAERTIAEHAERAMREKLEWLDRELAWRFDRVQEVEERIERAANAKLAWIDEELGKRVATLEDACTRAESSLARAGDVLQTLGDAGETIERAEAIASRLESTREQAVQQVELLSRTTQEAAALRESVATIAHDVAASREVVGGELRRMRDDLFWLTERGERISTQLVDTADGAAVATNALRSQVDAVGPALEELAAWAPLLSGENRERIRPVAEAIAGRVRDSLAIDMRGFSLALRQFADRADQAFVKVRLDAGLLASSSNDPPLVEVDPKSIAHSLAAELSRLGQPTMEPRTQAAGRSPALKPALNPAHAASGSDTGDGAGDGAGTGTGKNTGNETGTDTGRPLANAPLDATTSSAPERVTVLANQPLEIPL
jgi:hypothetical protein